MDPLEHLRYPVGRLPRRSGAIDRTEREQHLAILDQLPRDVRALTESLGDAQLDTRIEPAAGPSGRSCIICPTAT